MSKLKCPGCGVLIQNENEKELGFIDSKVLEKKENDFLCLRCFKLKNYNQLIDCKKVETVENLKSLLKPVDLEKNLIVYIVDAFDLSGSIINNINSYFNTNNILIVANKYDLFLRSNRPTKIKKYINNYLESMNIKTIGVIVTSSVDKEGIKKLYNSLEKISEFYCKLYFVGVCNVGKTSILKALDTVSNQKQSNIVVSNAIGTTIGLMELQIGNLKIVDTPGIVNEKQITYFLDKETLNYAIPKKFVKPKVFQLNPNQTIFIEGFGFFSYSGTNKCSLVLYFSNLLKIHRTKTENCLSFYNNHKDDIFRFPNPSERERLGILKTVVFDKLFKNEICLSGLGFVAFFGSGSISVTTFENVVVDMRENLI